MRINDKPKRLYWIFDATSKEVVYVGISEVPHFRIRCHMNSNQNLELKQWLRANRNNFGYEVSDQFPSETEIRKAERDEIAFLKRIGHAKFNKTKGLRLTP